MQEPPNYSYRNKDAAKRMSDIVRLHQSMMSKDEILAVRFIGIRLSDGGSNGMVYETHADAVNDHRNEPSRCVYFPIPLETWTPKICDVLLWWVTNAYNNGYREDPAHALILPNSVGGMMRGYGS